MRLKDYIRGKRRGKAANRLEREAMSDPFLHDALEGFDAVAGDHLSVIERLETKYTHSAAVPRRNRTVYFYWSAAASVLLLIGFSAYFFLESPEKTTSTIAMNQPDENLPVESMESQPEQTEKPQQEMPVVARMSQKMTHIPAEIPESDEWREVSDATVEIDIGADEIVVVKEVAAAEIVSDRPVESSAKLMLRSEQKIPAIHGKIVDETGEPLPGASIVEKGTTSGTVTDANGNFALRVATDSSKLMASFAGYETQEIKPSDEEQTVVLKASDVAIEEVVVMAFGVQKKSSVASAVSTKDVQIPDAKAVRDQDAGSIISPVPHPFGEKEFQVYCLQKADKNICAGRGVSVKVSFFIDETGKPTNIEYRKYSCEDAKKEMENLLSFSPAWTKTNRKVTVTVRW